MLKDAHACMPAAVQLQTLFITCYETTISGPHLLALLWQDLLELFHAPRTKVRQRKEALGFVVNGAHLALNRLQYVI
jgi:hypothetical protein